MKFDFDVLAAVSPAPRGEFLNVGIVLWRNGDPQIYPATTAARLSALDPNYPRLPVFKSLLTGTLGDEIAHLIDPVSAGDVQVSRMLLDTLIAPMKRSSGGEIFCEPEELHIHIESALDQLVRRPEITVKSDRQRRPGSRLETQMRAWFRGSKIMGRGMEDLSRSRVVAQYPVSVEADVYADFAYKNGALHVIETLDLRGVDHVTHSLRNTAAFKSITLDLARDVVGNKGRRIGVVAASDYGSVKAALRLFERNADDLFSLDSPEDAQRLADLLAKGLHIDGGLLPVALPS